MIKILPFEKDFVLALEIDGRIEGADFNQVVNAVDDKLERHDKLRVYVELRSIKGVSISSLFEDLKRALKHWNRFDKFALITDNTWVNKAAPVVDRLFPGMEVAVYSADNKAQAGSWLQTGTGIEDGNK